jgi:hypothetical protein
MVTRKKGFLKFCALSTAAVLALGCENMKMGGEKKNDDKSGDSSNKTDEDESGTDSTTDEAGFEKSADDVTYSGQLNLSGYSLAASEYDIVAFRLENGTLSDKLPMKAIALKEDGSFDATIGVGGQGGSGGGDDSQKYVKADGSIDRDAVKRDNPDHASEIDGMTDEQLKTELSKDHEGEGGEGGGNGPKDISWALVLRNKTLDATDKMASLVRFIGVSSGDANLFGMRVSDMKPGAKVTMGAVNPSTGIAQKSLDDMSGEFADAAALNSAKEISRTNKALQTLSNVYANVDTKTGSKWGFQPFFSFGGQLSKIKNAFSTGPDTSYMDMGVYINIDDPRIDFDKVCGTSAGLYQIVPPEDVEHGGVVNGPNNPISNAGRGAISTTQSGENGTRECSNSYGATNGMLFVRHFTKEGRRFLMNTTVDGLPPEGIWKIKYDGQQLAQFNLSPATPIDQDGKPLVYVPSVKVTVDSTHHVKKVEVKFLVYENGAYRELNGQGDMAAFRKVVTQIGFGMDDHDGTSSNNQRKEKYGQIGFPQSGNIFSKEITDESWLFGDQTSTSELVAGSITVDYDMYGNRYRFDFRPSN